MLLEFEALSTNTAGSLRISSGAVIIGGIRAREETLIFTDNAMFSMQFIGPPFTFGVNMINEGIGCIGPKAMVTLQEECIGWTTLDFISTTVQYNQYLAVYKVMFLTILTLLSLTKLLHLVLKNLTK